MRSAELNSDSCQGEQEFSFSGALTIELMRAAFSKGACFRFKVKGFSMSPFIKDEDIVTLALASNSSVRLGEPIGCILPHSKRFIIHRVIKKTRNSYLVKGDNISNVDGLISKESILGAVTRVERRGRGVFFGNGPERVLIAFLSRVRLLPFFFQYWGLIPSSVRKFIQWKMHL